MTAQKKKGIGFESLCALVILIWVVTGLFYILLSQQTRFIGNTPNHLVINEVELNPDNKGADSDAGLQWVELYNPTGEAIQLTNTYLNYTLDYGWESQLDLKDSGTVPAYGEVVIPLTGLAINGGTVALYIKYSADQEPQVLDKAILGPDNGNDDRTWQRFPDGNYADPGSNTDENYRAFTLRPMTRSLNNGDNGWIFWLSLPFAFGWPAILLVSIPRKRKAEFFEGLALLIRSNPESLQRCVKIESRIGAKRLEKAKKALIFIDSDVTPGELEYIAYWLAGVIVVAVTMFILTYAGSPNLYGVAPPVRIIVLNIALATVLVFLLVYNFIAGIPSGRAALLRTRGMGRMSEVIYYMAISMSLAPAIEKAIAFAASNSDPPLSNGLRRVLWQVHTRKYDSVEASLLAFADEWGEWNTDFKRALYAIVAAQGESTRDGRRFALQRATDIILDGTKAKLQQYASKLSGPTMVLFSMGILLPLIIGSTLPMAAMGGIKLTTAMVALLIDVTFPLVAFIYASRILRNRPEALTIPKIKLAIDRKDVMQSLMASAGLGAGLAGLVILLGFVTGAGITTVGGVANAVGVGAGIGAFLLFLNRKRVAQRRRIQEVEDAFPDAVYQLGTLMTQGTPLEVAIKKVATGINKGEITKELEKWSYHMTISRQPPEDTLFGANGLLNDYPSRIVRSTMRMVVGSVQKDPSQAGKTIIGISGYLRDLKQVEHEVRNALQNNVSMMMNTALFFAPLVLAISVAMYRVLQGALSGISISSSTPLGSFSLGGGSTIPLGDFGTVMGVYLILTTMTIAYFCSGIMNGNDKIERNHMLGQMLPISMTVFGVVFAAALTLFPG